MLCSLNQFINKFNRLNRCTTDFLLFLESKVSQNGVYEFEMIDENEIKQYQCKKEESVDLLIDTSESSKVEINLFDEVGNPGG